MISHLPLLYPPFFCCCCCCWLVEDTCILFSVNFWKQLHAYSFMWLAEDNYDQYLWIAEDNSWSIFCEYQRTVCKSLSMNCWRKLLTIFCQLRTVAGHFLWIAAWRRALILSMWITENNHRCLWWVVDIDEDNCWSQLRLSYLTSQNFP